MQVLRVNYRDTNAPADFTRSLKETGFGILTQHPIPMELVNKVYNEWELFFASTSKFNYQFDPEKQDGYFPFGTENAKGYTAKDLKEFYHIYPWGRFPDKLSGATMDLYNQILGVTSNLLEWIESNSPRHIKAHYRVPLKGMIIGSKTNLLRVIHYPPLDGTEEHSAVRAAAHEDINLITLLVAGTQPGLQVRDTNGKWHEVSSDLGSLVINAGDMLQEASSGYFPSTTHRVINPGGDINNESRYSMPLFLHPRDDVMLSKNYTAREYLDERLEEIGLKS